MYSVHVSSNETRKSTTRRIANRYNEHRTHQRRPLIRISNANQLIRYVRDNLFNLCSSKSKVQEREFDEFETPSISGKPEKIDVLCELTSFSKRQIKIMYREFKSECPMGVLTEDVFKSIYQQLFPKGANLSSYAHFVFCSFDKESTGSISFTDFILGLSLLTQGTVQEKLNWIFRLYDVKKKGFLEKEDFQRILISVYEIMGTNCKIASCCPIDEKEHLNLVFQKFDVNKTGTVTLNDFIKTCLKDEQIVRSLDVLHTVL